MFSGFKKDTYVRWGTQNVFGVYAGKRGTLRKLSWKGRPWNSKLTEYTRMLTSENCGNQLAVRVIAKN